MGLKKLACGRACFLHFSLILLMVCWSIAFVIPPPPRPTNTHTHLVSMYFNLYEFVVGYTADSGCG